ncbi:MAG: hypothetical protein JO368_12340 [Acidimicrobiales bacterium]|nr:hypothetical protein [Acidimicrobiales bacterium]
MSELRQLKRETGDLLTGLGATPEQVARSLAAAGVEGLPRSNRSCAIARYLTAVMGGEPSVRAVAVGPCSLMIHMVRPRDGKPAGRLLVQLPKPVRQFVAAFDAGDYPELERGTSGTEVRPMVTLPGPC